MLWTMELRNLPRLGVGISAEFESARTGIDAVALAEAQPGVVDFLEYGCDLARGLDDHVLRWAEEERLDRLVLHASDQGRALYERLGFVATNEMRYRGRSWVP